MSKIKGGGSAVLNDETQEELVSLLMNLSPDYGGDNDDDDGDDTSKLSDHDRRHKQKQFIKRLTQRYKEEAARRKFSKVEAAASEAVIKSRSSARVSSSDPTSSTTTTTVRFTLVEAIWPASKSSSSSSKSKKGSSKSKNEPKFKEGKRKPLCLNRTTSVKDVLKSAKGKLQMKKKPIRCFVVVEGDVEMELTDTIMGLENDAVVYVTSQIAEEEKETKKPAKEEEDLTETVQAEDPLDAVKQAYAQPTKGKRNQKAKENVSSSLSLGENPVVFEEHFDSLPAISGGRSDLPAAKCREEILKAVDSSRVVILCGATGCGKSTQVPQFLLEGMRAAGTESKANILITQPRRVAATALAERVAVEQGSPSPGERNSTIGYHVRLDRAIAPNGSTRIVYCTVGILLRMILCPRESADGNESVNQTPLPNISHLVIDEVHERDINTDFILTLLRVVLVKTKHVRIILMSATAAADLFARHFQPSLRGELPPILTIPGRTFPVETKWLKDCESFSGSRLGDWMDKDLKDAGGDTNVISGRVLLSPRAKVSIDNYFIARLVTSIVVKSQKESVTSENGAILVFLPGKAEIDKLAKALEDSASSASFFVLKLHSMVPKKQQKSVFQKAPKGQVKIVLSTNIAETSITIPDITHVIDTGRVKESRFNNESRIKELATVWTSQASAKQRAGRAGRTSAGTCWRLYSEDFFNGHMLRNTAPEILRTPLDELVLQVCLLYEQQRDSVESTRTNGEMKSKLPEGVCPVRFLSKAPESPPLESLESACKHLLEVGAITTVAMEADGNQLYRLTPLGYHLSRLPMDAKIGKVLIIGCILECATNALTIAAALSCTKSCIPFRRWGNVSDAEWKVATADRNNLVATGFGGASWKGGTVKGDLVATVAIYRRWVKEKSFRQRVAFCQRYALDNSALVEIDDLRQRFFDCLGDAGFLPKSKKLSSFSALHDDDALLTGCCLVAGLYPNIAALMRPSAEKGRSKVGRLIVKEGDICKPSSNSFQAGRVSKANQTGRDAYAVYHWKQQVFGTNGDASAARRSDVYLSQVDFVPRYALLLFGGDLEVVKNALIVDEWLKFKVGNDEHKTTNAILICELRRELDRIMLRLIVASKEDAEGNVENDETERVLLMVRKLLSEDNSM